MDLWPVWPDCNPTATQVAVTDRDGAAWQQSEWSRKRVRCLTSGDYLVRLGMPLLRAQTWHASSVPPRPR